MTNKKAKKKVVSKSDSPSLFPKMDPPKELEEILHSLEGKYSLIEECGKGKTGIAYKIQLNTTKRLFCLKTAKLELTTEADLQRFRDNLIKEIEILLPLNHQALPGITQYNTKLHRPYYICNYHPGKTFQKFAQDGSRLNSQASAFVISTLLDVLEFLHLNGRTHCDLHSRNVLVSENVLKDGILVIDFGSGHRESDSSEITENRGNALFKPDFKVPFGKNADRKAMEGNFKSSDFIALGALLQEAENCFFSDGTQLQKSALSDYTKELRLGQINDWNDAKRRFDKVVDPYQALSSINKMFQDDSSEQRAIPLPVSRRVPVSSVSLQLINTPAFQKLRWIKQLSFCDWYFPGACHNRFEHSLGVFNLARKAINKLSRDKNFRERYSSDELAAFLIASLFHDLGHYPFAHVLEQYAASRYSDDTTVKNQVSHSNLSRNLIQSDEIQSAVKKSLGSDRVVNLAISVLDGKLGVLSDLIDGPIDCDKLDYLSRDAHHCGLPFGDSIDIDSFLTNLHCSEDCSKLGISYPGVSGVEAFMILQDQMLSSVYWHETMRGIICMFHVAVAHIVKTDKDHFIELVNKIKKSPSESDALNKIIIPEIRKKVPSNKIDGVLKLINLHNQPQYLDIYKPIATYRHSDKAPQNRPQSVHQKLVPWNPTTTATSVPINWKSVRALREAFSKALTDAGTKTEEHEIIIDVPTGKNANRMVPVVASNGAVYDVTSVSHLNKTIFDHPALFASPIRVFVAPNVAENIQGKSEMIRTISENSFLSQ